MMMLLFALAIAAPPQASAVDQSSIRATVQARASVRIVSGVRISFTSADDGQRPAARESTIRGDGTARLAKLVEFQ